MYRGVARYHVTLWQVFEHAVGGYVRILMVCNFELISGVHENTIQSQVVGFATQDIAGKDVLGVVFTCL